MPDGVVGRVLGLSVSAQYAGQVLGPVLGGLIAGVLRIRAVFVATAVVLMLGALLSRASSVRAAKLPSDAHRPTRPAAAVHHR